jgi:hypothetical protein
MSQLHAAVEILEQGLATIFQQMLQLKTNVDALPRHQDENFLDLSSRLYSGTFTDPISIVEERNYWKRFAPSQGLDTFSFQNPLMFFVMHPKEVQ